MSDLNIFDDIIDNLDDLIRLDCKREDGLVMTRFGGGIGENSSKITSIDIYIDNEFLLNWKVGCLINIRPHQMNEDLCQALRKKIGLLFKMTSNQIEKECIRYNQFHWYSD